MTDAQAHALKVLEFPRVLELAAERCSTVMGVARIRRLMPTFATDEIRRLIAQTGEAVRLLTSGEPPAYGAARDIGTAVEMAIKGATLPGDDIFRILETIGVMSRLRAHFARDKEGHALLWEVAQRLAFLSDLERELQSSISPEGDVLDTASSALKKIRSDKNTHQRRLTSRIQNLIAGPLRAYLQDPIFTVREGRYVLPVKAQHKGKVPGILHDASSSGHTVFIEPETVVADSNKLRELEAEERDEVNRILTALSNKIAIKGEEILNGLEALTELDAILAKGRFALDTQSHEPALSDGHFIQIDSGHHPLIDREVSVPVDVSVGGTWKSMLITGPNTGGKTVTLKLIGLYVALMSCGIFPPAQAVKYGPFTAVFADIGDEQSVQQSLSTFSGHLRNIGSIFASAIPGSLALIDEIGAGTDPMEGAALGKAILSALAVQGVTIAASTHYGELKIFAQESDDFLCAAMEFDVATLRPTYRLIPGASGRSHAFEISRMFGLPPAVVDAAEHTIGDDAAAERSKSETLDILIAQAREDRIAATELLKSAHEERNQAAAERDAQLEKFRKLRGRMEEEVAAAIRESRERYRELLELAKSAAPGQRESLIESAKQIALRMDEQREAVREPAVIGESTHLEAGMEVRLLSNGQSATVLELQKSGKVLVQVGAMRMAVSPTDVEAITTRGQSSRASSSARRISLERTLTSSTELHLRQMRVEDAIAKLESFFDDALLSGLHTVRIVHGKGEGVLKKVVREFLQNRAEVKSFGEADATQGGAGVTVVQFK